MGFLSQGVSVETDAHGVPQVVEWQGVTYQVVGRPVRRYEREQWWARPGGRGAPLGGAADHILWRVRVRGGGLPAVVALELVQRLDNGRWRLLRMQGVLEWPPAPRPCRTPGGAVPFGGGAGPFTTGAQAGRGA
ncbi:hypothetical protein GCM10009595_06950 [Falsarthrobacter nasiphocae]